MSMYTFYKETTHKKVKVAHYNSKSRKAMILRNKHNIQKGNTSIVTGQHSTLNKQRRTNDG